MNPRTQVLSKFRAFTRVAMPILYCHDEAAYEEALGMIEYLMELVGDDQTKPENLLIVLLSHAIMEYESSNEKIREFDQESREGDPSVATLRLLIDQHRLTLSDLPEIGHKSLVSKILSGERNLTRTHIAKLSKRFHIDPALFF